MVAINETVDLSCQQLIAAFFKKYPNPRLEVEVNRILKRFMALKIPMPGKPGGWAGGIVYAISSSGSAYRECSIVSLRKHSALLWELSISGLP